MSRKHRGNEIIEKSDGLFYYVDTNERVADTWKTRDCGYCGLSYTKEGHDGCLGVLNKSVVMNACCGHGNVNDAYIQTVDGKSYHDKQALYFISELLNKV